MSTVAAAVLLVAPRATLGQVSPADSAKLVKELHDLQREFERFRERRTPVDRSTRPSGVCDELIGRICIWFGGEDEEDVPGELREVGQARTELIRSLADGLKRIHDRWVLGQLVHYLVESRNLAEAEQVATTCGIAERWWCSALRGYALHVRGEYVDAEAAFRQALDLMPDSVRHEWTTPRYVFTDEGVDEFNRLAPAEREREFDLLWRLSDPLFLVQGNDRLTDHFARLVVAENRRDAADPLGLDWGEDLEEALVRYGLNTGYSRTQDLSRMMTDRTLDTRHMVGHHHAESRGYLFPEQFMQSPSDIPPESWITAPREARTWYAPPYAPDIRGLETQVGRFRRDDRMLVVGAYRPTLPDEDEKGKVVDAWGPDGRVRGRPYAALFLIPEDGQAPLSVRGDDPEGVLAMQAPPGRYVSGLEVVDLDDRRAWRARQGVVQLPLTPGVVDVSDLMILRDGAPLPETLEEAIPNMRAGVRVRAGERFTVVWEAYGLRILEPVRVTLGFSRGRPGFLTRVGELLGVLGPAEPVEITFEDAGPDTPQAVFRAMALDLPDLDPGEYTLQLRLESPGHEPVITSRPIVVER